MTKVLIAWELGGGLGHLMTIRTLASALTRSGHDVTIASRDVYNAASVIKNDKLRLTQAPHRTEPYRGQYDPPISYVHMLNNIGFGSADGLAALVQSWRQIINSFKPDKIICEHSPTALLACRSFNLPTSLIGTGFTIPPTPLPLLRPNADIDHDQLRKDENRTLEVVNKVASKCSMDPLGSVGEIYTQCEESFLMTYPELDHFSERASGNYVGVEVKNSSTENEIDWPTLAGPRIFAYLKPRAGFREAVRQLSNLAQPTILYCPGVNDSELDKLAARSPSIAFSNTPVNVDALAKNCDVSICHGGHGLVAQMLLAGTPIVTIPTQAEQALLCRRICDCNHPLGIRISDTGDLAEATTKITEDRRYHVAAQSFSTRHAGNAQFQGLASVMNWVEGR